MRLDDFVNMKIEVLSLNDKVPVNCPKCKTTLDKIYCRYEDSEIDVDDDVFDLKVLKCPECKTVYSYWIDNSDIDSWLSDEMEITEPTRNQPLDNKRKPRKSIYRKRVEAYKKAILAKEERIKELDHLINPFLPELQKASITIEIINFAKNRVLCHIKNKKFSPKSLTKLLASAIYAKSNSVPIDNNLRKYSGEGISLRKLEEIFKVTRKTISKWSKLL